VGSSLPAESWNRRHRILVLVLAAHLPGLLAFGLLMGRPGLHVLGEVGAVAALALLAAVPRWSRRVRATIASLGLLSCSALLVHFSGGYIEAHFHFFVAIIVISLYQEWLPFLMAIGYVAVHHGVVGSLDPSSVYNHADAWAQPWAWAGIHAAFVLAASAASLVNWRVNELSRAEALTAQSRLRAVVTGAPVLLFATDPRLRITMAAGKAFGAVGMTPAQALGREARLLFPGDGTLTALLRQAYRGEVVATSVFAGGKTFDLRLSPRHDELGGVRGVIGVATDVTEQRRAEDAERAAQERLVEQLKEVDRFKTSLINMAGHELFTPLTPQRIQVDLLKSRDLGDLSDRQQRAVEVLDRSIERLTELVRDVLEVARLQSGRMPVQLEDVELNRVVDEAVEFFQEPARRGGIALAFHPQEAVWVRADAARVSQVLFNLLSNALKFTPAGGSVTVETGLAGEAAVVRVRDTGSGLTQEQLARLFQPFTQVHEAAQGRRGTGLGLYISRGIVEQHGGRIAAHSDGPGQGARFEFTLPVAVPQEPASPLAPALAAPAQEP
jgi:PAS domain S-box-containing protein